MAILNGKQRMEIRWLIRVKDLMDEETSIKFDPLLIGGQWSVLRMGVMCLYLVAPVIALANEF